MISNSKQLSSSTKEQYSAIHNRLHRQTRDRLGNGLYEPVDPNQIVFALVMQRPELAKRTWALYRSALLYSFREEAEKMDHDDHGAFGQVRAREYRAAIEWLSSQTQSEAKKRGTSTSSLKAKSIKHHELRALLAHLSRTSSRNPDELKLADLISATVLSGLRPCEWVNAELSPLESGEQVLIVKNAKATNGRGNGQYRTLFVNHFGQETLDLFNGVIQTAKESSQKTNDDHALYRKFRHLFYRTVRKVLTKRQRYPSLYTFRHQFAANVKKIHTQEEVAALLGHASDATASRHYGKGRQGWKTQGTKSAKPAANEVARVRRSASARRKLGRSGPGMR